MTTQMKVIIIFDTGGLIGSAIRQNKSLFIAHGVKNMTSYQAYLVIDRLKFAIHYAKEQ